MTELTPAVYDAAHQLGYAMARAGLSLVRFIEEPFTWDHGPMHDALDDAFEDGHTRFTPEAEAARLEAVVEAAPNASDDAEKQWQHFMRLAAMSSSATQGVVNNGTV